MLLQTKSLLAKLMATENLHIEQRRVETAMFNVKTRVLTVPILDEEVEDFIYDLFMGHEVGHALYTPFEDWVEAQVAEVQKSILNVVEDSRIERKIKYKYPGLRNSFVKAYKNLDEKNFFSTKGLDLNKLNFIDRVNLHQKVGAGLNIHFTDFERSLLTEVESTEKFEDVITVSKKIQKYMEDEVKNQVEQEERQKQKIKVKVTQGDEEDNNSSDGFDYDPENDEIEVEFEGQFKKPSELKDDAQPANDDGEGSKITSMSDSNSELEKAINSAIEKAIEERVRSFTDEAYKENEKTLYHQGSGQYSYINLPTFDVDKAVFDYKALYKLYKEDYNYIDTQQFNKIRSDSNKVVSYLVKEFELRKNAEQSKRTTVAKTGELDMGKVFSYQFSEDIFRKISITPGGKSHGLVMFLDWSGSMHNHLENTVKQLISLVLFCKKVNIPYEVYSFTDESIQEYSTYQNTNDEGDLQMGQISLLNVLSSRMSAADFTYACSALVHMSRERTPDWMRLGSTPLNETISLAMEIIPAFQKKNNLQIVNTVFLTDGDANCTRSVYEEKDEHGYKRTRYIPNYSSNVIVLRDKKSKNEVTVRLSGRSYGAEFTHGFIKLLKEKTKCNIVGFYIASGREFNNAAEKWYERSEVGNAKESFRKNNFAVLKDSGFDEYYFLRSNKLDTDEEEFEVKENVTQRGLISAFSKYAGSKVENRVVLNRFISMIA